MRITHYRSCQATEAASALGVLKKYFLLVAFSPPFCFLFSHLFFLTFFTSFRRFLCVSSRFVFMFGSPGGMEKPEDDFEETHNVRVASKDTLFGGVVSRLQVRFAG